MKKTILVTGGAGFIGSHLVDHLIKEGCKVIVVDNLSSGKRENLNPKTKFYQADIQDQKISDIFKKEKPKIVFHFAAHIEARESIKNPIYDARTNILGSLNILENCRKFKVKELIFASSGGEIYGQAKKIPTLEDYPPQPLSPYGVTKLTVEKYLEVYYRLFGLRYKALRYGNVYGPRQNPKGEAGVVAIFSNKMLKNEQPFIHGNGKQTKDYIFIEDAINATILSQKKDFIGYLNIGSGKETSVLEIFDQIKKMTGSQVQKKYTALPPNAFPRGCLDIKKVKKILGWQPKYNFAEGLKKTVDWFKGKL